MKKPLTCPVLGPVASIGQQIDKLNVRDNAIQARLGVIGAESAKLCTEQAGIQLRRVELMRSSDNAARQ